MRSSDVANAKVFLKCLTFFCVFSCLFVAIQRCIAADDSARHSDQLVDGDAAVLIFGHVDANDLLLVAEGSVETAAWADSMARIVSEVHAWTGNQAQLVEHLVALDLGATGDCLGCFEVESAEKYRQPAE